MIEWSDPAICRFTEVDADGFVSFQPAYFGTPTEQGGGPSMAALHPFGLQSRPRDPDVDAKGNPSFGAPLFFTYFGDRGYALPLFDPRDAQQATLPMPSKGGSLLYASLGGGRYATLALSGDDGVATLTVPEGATIRLKAPSGRTVTVSATGTDIIGITNVGAVSADDPGSPPAPVAIAGPLASFISALETWALQVDIAVAAVQSIAGVPPAPSFAAAVAARIAVAATIAGTYPGGMTATRLNAR